MAILKNRYEIMALVSATMCNPNGDPDFDNRPRMDFETNQGIITDVAFKARMRNYILETCAGKDGCNILMRNGNSVNRAIAEAVLDVNNGVIPDKKKNPKVEDSVVYMCNKYWDVRTFGAVLSTGLNAGQVRGAVQVSMSVSVDLIEPITSTITRCCYTAGDYKTLDKYDEADANMETDKKRTMGAKSYIPYGLYIMKVTVSANLAKKVGFTEDDLKLLLESIVQMYNCDVSSSKMGMSVLTPIVVFKHVGTTDAVANPEQSERECLMGCASAYKLFEMLTVKRKADVDIARSYTDYDIQLHMENCPAGIEVGLKKSAYGDVEWLDSDLVINLLAE